MLRIPHCVDNRLTVNCEILTYLRERERERYSSIWGGGSERHLHKRGNNKKNLEYEGSQALPASPSGKVVVNLGVNDAGGL
jgi:hypothetical protein